VIKLSDIISYFSSAETLDLKPGYRVLADYSDVILQLSNEDIHQMARQRKMMIDVNEKINQTVFLQEYREAVYGGRKIGS